MKVAMPCVGSAPSTVGCYHCHEAAPCLLLYLQEVMVHPWVTDEGRITMQGCAAMGLGSIEVTAQEQLGAIDRASVVSMIRARLKEKSFRSLEYLFQVVGAGNAKCSGICPC